MDKIRQMEVCLTVYVCVNTIAQSLINQVRRNLVNGLYTKIADLRQLLYQIPQPEMCLRVGACELDNS